MGGLRRSWSGHFWTIARDFEHRLRPLRVPDDHPWSLAIEDPKLGPLTLRGRVRHDAKADTVVVLVHGLGGSADSPYMLRTAVAVAGRGWACLRVNLRGAGGSGDDFYHAGLVEDLERVVESLSHYDRVLVVGYSLGGHLVLRYALKPDPRVRAVAVIGAPLDLDQSAVAFDRRRSLVYRHVVLNMLKRDYRHVATRRPVHTPVEQVERVRTIRQWDRLVVVGRHDFGTVENYYATQSVGPRLSELSIPALYVGATGDPMVPDWTVRPSLATAGPNLQIHMLDAGGHVGFPPRVLLAEPASSLDEQVTDWLARITAQASTG